METFEQELAPTRKSLREDVSGGGKELCEKEESFVSPLLRGQKMTHLAAAEIQGAENDLTRLPEWAKSRDVKAAVLDLQRLGVLKTPDEFCELISIGSNRLLPTRQRSTFADHKTLDFWLGALRVRPPYDLPRFSQCARHSAGMVTLFVLGLHNLVKHDFKKRMEQVSSKESEELSMAPIKQASFSNAQSSRRRAPLMCNFPK